MITQPITFLILLLYVVNTILIYKKLNKIFKAPGEYHIESDISIVIAAKNEAENISALMSSLVSLDYPQHKMEIIIIDDNSKDETFKIVKEKIKTLPHFKLFSAKGKKYPGKKGAINAGIESANNPFIFITDADCKLEPNILKSLSGKFKDGYDFVFGPALFFEEKKLINRITCFENLRNSMLMLSAAGFGIPYCAAARNFAFKKSAFEKLDGFDKISETLSGDDDLLLQLAVKNKLKIGIITDRLSNVYSNTKKSFSDYLSQRARHTQASFHYLPSRKILLTLWHSANLFLLFSPVLIFLSQWFILPFLIKFLFDIILVSRMQNKFTYSFKFYEIILFQIIYELLLIINLFNAKFTKIKWK